MKLISVIVPVYNIEKYIGTCIESICNQTYENIEIILVDDGSMDCSGELCDKYAERDKLILVIHKQNGGLVSARKAGLNHAHGEYCCFVDGDDYIDKQMVMDMVEEMDDDYDFIHYDYMVEGNKRTCAIKDRQIIVLMNQFDRIQVIGNNMFGQNGTANIISNSICIKFFQIEFLRECYDLASDDCSYGEDLLCLMYAIMKADKIKLVPKAFYHYRYIEGSLSHTWGMKNIVKDYELFGHMVEILKHYEMYSYFEMDVKKKFWGNFLNNLDYIQDKKVHLNRYICEDLDKLRNKKVIIYGAGVVGKDFYHYLRRYMDIDVVAWVDKKAEELHYEYCDVYNPKIIHSLEYDFVLIATLTKKMAEEIRMELCECGIDTNKVLWREPQFIFEDRI